MVHSQRRARLTAQRKKTFLEHPETASSHSLRHAFERRVTPVKRI
jgi:hypothetical protein